MDIHLSSFIVVTYKNRVRVDTESAILWDSSYPLDVVGIEAIGDLFLKQTAPFYQASGSVGEENENEKKESTFRPFS